VAGEASGQIIPTLGWIENSDLLALYDQYKINWIRIRLIPRFDPGQSGVVNNSDVWVAMACDPANQVSTPTFLQVTAYGNAKVAPLLSGREFTYTFKPRPVNTLAAGNYGVVDGNSWLIANAGGASVLHYNLIWNIKSGDTSSTTSYDYVLEYNISLRTIS